jgi:hypothetical protein
MGILPLRPRDFVLILLASALKVARCQDIVMSRKQMKTLGMMGRKGGVGKTTLSVHLGPVTAKLCILAI